MSGSAAQVLRAARVALLLLVAATLVEGTSPARAQDAAPTTTLAGLQGRAAASGVHAFYAPVGLLPIPNLADLGAPDALATITSGPSTFARAGVLDPGDLIANPDAALALMMGAAYPAGTIPRYPYRISANSSTGDPPVESTPAPGLSAHVRASGGSSEARAAYAESAAPGLVRVGSALAEATTETDGSTVTIRARSELGGIDIVGLLEIEALVTEVTATSDGTETKLVGGTTVTGASLLGQAVTIDADGVHLAENGSDTLLGGLLGPLVGNLNDVLAAAGLEVTVAGPVELGGGTSGQLAATGLRIDVNISERTFPALGELLALLPPIENPLPGVPSIEDLLQVVQANHVASVEVGRAVVALSARPTPDRTPFTPPTGGIRPPAVGTTPTFGGGGVSLPPVVPPSAPADPGGAAVPVRTATSVPTGAGIAGLVALALLSAPFIGDRLAAMATAILGAGGAGACPREGT